jgi:hypothetical protein
VPVVDFGSQKFDGLRWAQLDLGVVSANLPYVHGNEKEVVAVGGRGVALHLSR